MKIKFLILSCVLACPAFSGRLNTDSLKKAFYRHAADTNRVNTGAHLCIQLRLKGEHDSAIKYGEMARELSEQLGFTRGLAWVANSLGNGYREKGNYPLALRRYLISLKCYDELGDRNKVGSVYLNIGNVHLATGNLQEALKCYRLTFEIKKGFGEKKGMSNAANNMGEIYRELKDYKNALQNFLLSRSIMEEVGDETGLAECLINIANVHLFTGNNQEALKLYQEALAINTKHNETQGMALAYNNLAELHVKEGRLSQAKNCSEKSLALSREAGEAELTLLSLTTISDVYEQMNLSQKALDYFLEAAALKDSLINEESSRNLIQQEFKFNYDKKLLQDSVLRDEEKKRIALKLEHEKTANYALYAGLGGLVLFGAFMIHRFRLIRKQKKTLQMQKETAEKQKILLEEKQKELLDSIRYARRIQHSLLPQEWLLRRYLNRPGATLLLLLLFSVRLCFAQGGKTDSLRRAMAKEVRDTAQFRLLLNLYQLWGMQNEDSARFYYGKANELAQKTKNPHMRARLQFEKGDRFYRARDFENAEKELLTAYAMGCELALRNTSGKGKDAQELWMASLLALANSKFFSNKHEEAVNCYARCVKIADSVKNKDFLGRANGNLGWAWSTLGNFNKAIEHQLTTVAIYKETGNKKQVAHYVNQLGASYYYISNYPGALECFYTSLRLYEELNSKRGISDVLGNLGNVFNDRKEYRRAIEFYKKALLINRELKNTGRQSENLNNMGVAYEQLADTANALDCYGKALDIATGNSDTRMLQVCYGNIGIIYAGQGKYGKADEYLKKGLKIGEELGDAKGQADRLVNLGMNSRRAGKYTEAETYLKRGLKLAAEIGSPGVYKDLHEGMFELYRAWQKPGAALKHARLAYRFRDSIYNEENTRKSIQQEFLFDYRKRAAADSVKLLAEKKLYAERIEQESVKKRLLFGGLGMAALLSAFILNRVLITRRQKTEIEAQKKIVLRQKKVIELRQKEITDSISYASRIQLSLMANEKYIGSSMARLRKEFG